MIRTARRITTSVLGLALMLPACATPQPKATTQPLQLVDAAGKLCAGAETFDLEKLAAKIAVDVDARTARIAELVAITPLPPGAEDAETRIRVRVPPTAMWGLDTRVTLWKDAEGAWQIATKNVNTHAPPPPPPPPPAPLGEDGQPLWTYPPVPPPPPPYLTSALSQEDAAGLDAALADPCFLDGPDHLPYAAPLLKTDEHGREDWLCPPDSAWYTAEVKLSGEPVRYILYVCYMDFAVSKLLTRMAYMSAAPGPAVD